MLRRLGIRGMVLAALAVPVLVLFLLAGTVSLQSLDQVREARAVTGLLGALDHSRSLAGALQAERDASLPLLTSDATARLEARGKLGSVRAATDRAVREAALSVEGLDVTALDPEVGRAVAGLRDQLVEIDGVRRAVDSGDISMREAFTDYSTVINRVTTFPERAADVLDDRRLAGIISTQTAVMLLAEDYRQEQVLGREVLNGSHGLADVELLTSLFAETTLRHDSTMRAVEQVGVDGLALPAPTTGLDTYGSVRALATTGERNYLNLIDPQEWHGAAEAQVADLAPAQQRLAGAAVERASDVAGAALRAAALTITATLLAVLLSVAAALTVARQIVNPLRRLTVAAGTVRDELPRLVEQVTIPGQGPDLALTRIPVDSDNEIGRLAAAFNEVNATTIQVAQEQAALRGSIAEMFVNVARRDQVLLNRQLSFIDALERTEEDPKTLADLFRLDHLATRMRRNAESLLVLAGIDTGRRLRDAISVSDVVRTASSEIEHYERVQLDLPIDPQMLGHTALPAAHLLAELLENATVFSQPGTPVQVSTGIDETHVIVTVLDQGLGMTPAELRDANTKIRATSAGDVLGAQRLGLFVVGRIAQRLGAEVELSAGPHGGTLATVRLPVALFADVAAIPPTAPVAAAPVPAQPSAPSQEHIPVVGATQGEPLQDVTAGSIGSAENPAEAVDLAALTDGRTGLGLPRRRSRRADAAPASSGRRRDDVRRREEDDAAAAPSMPSAPRAEDLAGVVAAPTTADAAWAPPIVAATTPIAVRRQPAQDAPAAPAPAGATSELPAPTRSQRGPVAEGDVPSPAVGDSAPAAGVQSRAAMFSGFRSRRAELAAAAVPVNAEPAPVPSGDGAERLAAAASGAAAFFGRSGAKGSEPAAADATLDPPAPMVIPALVEDDDEDAYPYDTAQTYGQGSHDDLAAQAGVADHGDLPDDGDLVPYATDALGVPAAQAGHGLRRTTSELETWPPQGHVEDAWSRPAETSVPVWSPEAAQPPAAAPAVPVWAPEPTPLAEQGVADAAPFAEQTWTQPGPVTEEGWAQPAPVADETWAQPVAVADETWTQPVPVADEAWAQPAPVADETWTQPVPVVAPAPGDGHVQVSGRRASRPAKRRWWQLRRGRDTAAEIPTPHPAPAIPPAPAEPASYAGAVESPASLEAAVAGPVPEPTWQPTFAPAGAAPMVPRAGASPAAVEPTPTAQPLWEPSAAPVWEAVARPAPAAWQAASPEPVQPVEAVQPLEPVQPFEPVQAFEAVPAAGATASQAPALPEQDVAAAWVPQIGWDVTPAAEAPVGAPLPARPAAASQTSFTPQPMTGALEGQLTGLLPQGADLAQEALAELSQLSSYRPQAMSGGGSGTLARRTPGTVPAAPEIQQRAGGQRPDRDANQVRSLLSNFQSGTARGREAADGPGAADSLPHPRTTGEGLARTGHENGPDGGRSTAVPTSDPDPTQRSN